MIIKFENVGRDRKTWEQTIPSFDTQTLYKAVKKQGALGSLGIEFEYDPETNTGDIYAGFRQVGTFSVVKA